MYARITRFAVSPDAIDQLVLASARHVIPRFEQMEGYAGGSIFADREHGQMVGIGYWRTLEAVEASAGALEAAGGTGMMFDQPLRVLSQEVFEVAHDHRVPPG
jgi:heme-degrading monooxygenase HmoA